MFATNQISIASRATAGFAAVACAAATINMSLLMLATSWTAA